LGDELLMMCATFSFEEVQSTSDVTFSATIGKNGGGHHLQRFVAGKSRVGGRDCKRGQGWGHHSEIRRALNSMEGGDD
jgi:hypothetical protein